MSRDPRKSFYDRDRVPIWGRSDYRSRDRPLSRKRTRSRSPPMGDKRRSGSPRKNEKDLLDENILREISKLPEPSELWDNNQFQENANYNSAPPPPAFQTEAVPNFQSNYQPSFSGIYDDFPPAAPPPTMPQEIASWNQMSLPPPPAPTPFVNNVEEQIKKEAAIETEMRHQKAALSKQREDYIKKASILKKELDTLKDQRDELRGDAKRSPSPDTKRFLKENTKLQLEIQNKLKTINNVVDMLNGIIGEEAHTEIVHDSDDSGKGSKQKSRSPSNKKFNYVYYDPEMHWCRVCNEFPPTAKDYLNHLHSAAHHKKLLRRMAAAHMEAPWHSVAGINEGFPNYPSAPTKRTPIKGLQFFVPSTAWYCKLCDQFIGDLHCASAHLKSVTHSKNYTNFVEQNPHWETDWMSDRQKAFEKARASNKLKAPEEKPQYTAHTITFHKDGFHTKNTDLPVAAPPEKKKKKEKKKKSKKKQSSSSSSSSNSSSSDSETEKKRKKSKTKKEKKIGATDEKTLTEWMTAIQMDRLNENDRKLLDTLKSRMKADKLKEEKRRSPDRDSSPDPRRKRDNERRDIDRDRRERNFRRSPSRSSRRSPRRSRSRSRARDSRESRESRARSPARAHSPPPDPKKPDIKKMPFIGKMPVYKHLGKKQEDQKKEEQDQKKKDEDEATKKRREEMDAEIQKKVAEFKEKIAKAQLERASADVPPPALALPTRLAAPPPTHPPPPSVATSVAAGVAGMAGGGGLPQDLQEALDIIFPSDVKLKPELQQPDLFLPPFPMPLGFPPLGLMQPQMPPGMFGFDMNAPLFQPQLYDTHVPLVPGNKPRPQQNKRPNNAPANNQKGDKRLQTQKQQNAQTQHNPAPAQSQSQPETKENGTVARKKEELDELAMLGIDASDVGAGM